MTGQDQPPTPSIAEQLAARLNAAAADGLAAEMAIEAAGGKLLSGSKWMIPKVFDMPDGSRLRRIRAREWRGFRSPLLDS